MAITKFFGGTKKNKFDISNHPIAVKCPNCNFRIDVLLKQVIAEETIILSRCRNNIKLRDKGGSNRHATKK